MFPHHIYVNLDSVHGGVADLVVGGIDEDLVKYLITAGSMMPEQGERQC